MALSDYFPYGAPELLKGAAARMARSTMGSSLLVTLLVVAFGAMRPSAVIDPEDLLPPSDPIVLQPPPLDQQLIAAPARPADAPPVELPDRSAIPELVPDVPEQDWEDTGPPPTEPPSEGPIGPVTPGSGPCPCEPKAVDPEPGEFVDVDELPAPLSCAAIHYPDLARAAGVEGTVRVRMLIGRDGRVERALIEPNGSVLLLDEAALDAARSCRFTPALRGGRAVKVWVSRAYRFTLH